MGLLVNCDECGKQYSLDEKFAGKKARCRACGAAMQVPELASSSVTPPKAAAPVPRTLPAMSKTQRPPAPPSSVPSGSALAGMASPKQFAAPQNMIQRPQQASPPAASAMQELVVCEMCGKQYQVTDNLRGKMVKCRACGHMLSIPGAAVDQGYGLAPQPAGFAPPMGNGFGAAPFHAAPSAPVFQGAGNAFSAPAANDPFGALAPTGFGSANAMGGMPPFGATSPPGFGAAPPMTGMPGFGAPAPYPAAPMAGSGYKKKKKSSATPWLVGLGICGVGLLIGLVLALAIPTVGLILGVLAVILGVLLSVVGHFWGLARLFAVDSGRGVLGLFIGWVVLKHMIDDDNKAPLFLNLGGGAIGLVAVGLITLSTNRMEAAGGASGFGDFEGDEEYSDTFDPDSASAQPFQFGQLASVPLPIFPERGPGRQIEPNVMLHEISLGDQGGFYSTPGHGGKIWLYLPAGQHAHGSLPCVFIAPAGSTMFVGMNLGESDQPEHLPYVRAGMAVIAYELDGPIYDLDDAEDEEMRRAYLAFKAAQAGLVNAKIAMEYALAKVPEIDSTRLFAAGHSSAGTMALQFAAFEPRIKACAAYAPSIDIEAFQSEVLAVPGIESVLPGIREFLRTVQPKGLGQRIQCPTFLFVAADDDVGPPGLAVSELERFHPTIAGLGQNMGCYFTKVPFGGHYDAMINEGVPMAVEWFKNPSQAPPGVGAQGGANGGAPAGFGAPGAGAGNGLNPNSGFPPGMGPQGDFGPGGNMGPPDGFPGGPPGGFGPGGGMGPGGGKGPGGGFGPPGGGFGPGGGMGPGSGFPGGAPGGFGPGGGMRPGGGMGPGGGFPNGPPGGGFGPGGFGPGGFPGRPGG